MPFTLSHVAAVLPLRGERTRRWLDFPALAIGAMAPDSSYVLALVGPYFEMHDGVGIFLAAWPVALLSWVLYRRWLSGPWIDLLPWLADRRPVRWKAGVVGTLVGVLSHVLWDAFTHLEGQAVPYLPFLTDHLSLAVDGPSIYVFSLLQHVSSLLGGAFVGVAITRAVRRLPERRFTTSWPRLGAILLVFTALWAVFVCTSSWRGAVIEPLILWVDAAFRGLGAAAIVFVSYALVRGFRFRNACATDAPL